MLRDSISTLARKGNKGCSKYYLEKKQKDLSIGFGIYTKISLVRQHTQNFSL